MSSSVRLVRCTAGGDTFCIENDWLDSIHVIENLYPSRSADGSIGWIRRFDEKVPVFRLADQLSGGSPRGRTNGVILVLTRNQRSWALLVDKVSGANEVSTDRLFPLPAIMGEAARRRFPSVIVEGEDLTLYLSPDTLVPTDVSGSGSETQTLEPVLPVSRARAENLDRRNSSTQPAASPSTPKAQASGSRGSASGRQIITFLLEHQEPLPYPIRFAISAGQALQIVNGLPMIQVPQSPPFVVGLASWRSMPVPVVDLGLWLGLPRAPHRFGSRVLLCRGTVGRSHRDIGLVAISAVDDLRKLDLPIAYKPWPGEVGWNRSLALGVYVVEKSMLVVPDLDAILSFQAANGPFKM